MEYVSISRQKEELDIMRLFMISWSSLEEKDKKETLQIPN